MKRMKGKRNWVGLIALLLGTVVLGGVSNTGKAEAAAAFAKGADVGWLSEMEYYKWAFYNDSGAKADCLQVLKDHRINSIRLRLWVNPTLNFSNEKDVLKMAQRAKNMGFRIMIDFHYSDTWADPGNQRKPSAWAGLPYSSLKSKVYSYTYDFMNKLKSAGVTPEWVQIGNETNNGMLWEDGKASSHMKQYAELVTNGYNAVKAVSSSTLVIVHLSNGYDNSLYRWMFDGLKQNGAKYDVIGMSLYPSPNNWSSLTSQCLANMKDMVARYGKKVMICEVGMDVSQASACKAFITDIIAKTKSVNGGLGVFYWEPECYGTWYSYTKGAFDSKGKPTVALDGFLN